MRGLYRYTVCKRNIQQRARTDRPLFAPLSFGGGRSRGGRVALALRVGLREGGARGGRFVSLPAGGLLFRIAGPAREELAQTSLERRRLFLASLRALRARGGRGGAAQHGRSAGFAPRVGRVSIEIRSARLRPASLGAPRGRDLVSLRCGRLKDSYLVDPASSHMLVSKIKPCMSKYNLYTGKLRMAH